MERDGREVGCLLGRGADAVLDIGSAFDREELGAGRGTPEKRHIWCMLGLVYATHKYFIKHIPSVRANICLYTSEEERWRMQARHRLEFPNRWRTKVAAVVIMKLVGLDDTELQTEPAEDVKSGRKNKQTTPHLQSLIEPKDASREIKGPLCPLVYVQLDTESQVRTCLYSA